MPVRTPVRLPYGPHWKGLADVEGVHDVRIDVIRRLAGALSTTIDTGGMMLISAPTGTGKSFTLARAAERCLQRKSNTAQLEWLEYSSWARGWTLLRELHEQLVGDGLADGLKPRALRQDLRQILSDRQRVLVLDEAQLVSPESLLVLSKLSDSPETKFALVIIATRAIHKKLPDEVRSRLLIEDTVPSLNDRDIVEVLCGYHDVFATANPKRLIQINNTQALGQFRYWAHALGVWWSLREELDHSLAGDSLEIVADVVAGNFRKRR